MKTLNENSTTKRLAKAIENKRPDFTLKSKNDRDIYFYKVDGGFIEEHESNDPVFTSLSEDELIEYYKIESEEANS